MLAGELNFPFFLFYYAGEVLGLTTDGWAVSLRIQTNPENKAEFSSVSNERYVVMSLAGWLLVPEGLTVRLHRAFADFVFGSMLLHFICVNFIN